MEVNQPVRNECPRNGQSKMLSLQGRLSFMDTQKPFNLQVTQTYQRGRRGEGGGDGGLREEIALCPV